MSMALSRLGWLAVLACFLGGPVAVAAEADVRSTKAVPPSPARLPAVGLMADVGVPDGAMGSLVVRPASWLRLHAGGGTNSASAGVRGGFSLVPFGAGPSLNLELGHFLDAETNGVVRSFMGGLGKFATYFRRVGYTYANAHLGLDFGTRRATFFIHGGVTYLWATLRNVQDAIDEQTMAGAQTTLTINEDPTIRILMPSVKLGLIVYLQ
jgi:hypothetical protein